MWTRAELKENAKKYFKFNYWKMVLVAFIMALVGGGGYSVNTGVTRQVSTRNYNYMTYSEAMAVLISIWMIVLVVMVIASLLSIFLFYPLQVGAQRFFVVSHYQQAELGELGYAFSNSYMNVVKTIFLRQLYIFLWSLLFIIPGIIKAYEYHMVSYILAENPGIDSKEAFAMSKQMMDGNKWNTFVLALSFYGWMILSAFTCGILGIFYVNPYMQMTFAELYVALKEITFGNQNSGYQNYQNYQGNQNYQNYQGNQNYQNYQGNQNYQNYQGNQNYQNYQGNQNYQNYQGNQNYQNYQGNQNYQNYQGGQNYQNYQPNQNYQNYQQNQNYQNGQFSQSYQPNQNYQQGQNYQNSQSDQNYQQGQSNPEYQDGNWINNNHQDDNFQL
ncbi:MAG: DUF975 family protein [Lachnospiraceae bacterium]|nr:DUF975 family protein [Lachnospiraceae bacterium]